MKRKLGIFWGLVGAVAVSAMSVSASTFETLPDSGDYEKIVALADEIVSSTNGGPVYDPFSEGVTVDDIDFDNALKEYIDTPLFTSELLSVSEAETALEESDYIWIVPIKAYGHLYEACAVRADGEDGQPSDAWHISDSLGVMYLGTIVERAPKRLLFSNPVHPYTKALFSSAPTIDEGNIAESQELRGEIPSPIHLPSGCPFHDRCPMACPDCAREVPELKEVEPGHFAACHLL